MKLSDLTGKSNYFEDFTVGQVIRHARGKTIEGLENVLITNLVMNTAQGHFNEHAMKTSPWKGRLSYGGVNFSLVMGLAMQDTGENALAELGLDNIRLQNPVVHGDTLYAFSEVLSKEDADREDAEVVKVEGLRGGDLSRLSGPFHAADAERRYSGYFQSINRGKKSIAVDLKSPAGVELIKRLVPSFDVVVENFRVGVMDRLGLSYETLAALHPPLVYAAIRGFGDPRTGESPYVDWPAYDVVAQAMGGMMGITGPAGGPPTKVGPGVGDTVPALYLALGIVSAVLDARRTGVGQFLDVAMVDAVLGVCERIVHQYSFAGQVPGPEGSHHPFLLPFGIYPAADGFVAIACPGDPFFRALLAALDAGDVLEEDAFATPKARSANRAAVIERLSALTAVFTKAQLQERLGGVVPFGPVMTIEEIAHDGHFAARGMLAPLALPGLPDALRVAGQPIKFARTPAGVRGPAPDLGADTAAVLREHGVADDDLARWREAGAIAEERGG